MEIKITVLSENTAGLGFVGEWGLSMLLEADGQRILFDTGAGIAIMPNAEALGVDLATVDRIVLSHGHYDHTGGLRSVLEVTGPKEIIAHPDIWSRKCRLLPSGADRYIGIPFGREELEALGARFTLTREPFRLTEHVTTTGEVPMVTGYEQIDDYLCVGEGEGRGPDPLADDLSLVIDADFGLVVMLGCAHRGIVNTLLRARELTGKELIYAALGGTHLINASSERLDKTVVALKEMGVQYLGASHCTDFMAASYLNEAFGGMFFMNNAGTARTLPF